MPKAKHPIAVQLADKDDEYVARFCREAIPEILAIRDERIANSTGTLMSIAMTWGLGAPSSVSRIKARVAAQLQEEML